MNKRLLLRLAGSFIASVAVVTLLIAVSGIMKDGHSSFLRLFPSHPVLEAETFDLKYNSFYLAGGTAHSIYLANHASPLHLLIINISRSDTQHVNLKVEGIMDQKFWSVTIKVDSPYFYVADGAVPRIYKGNVIDWTADRIAHDREYFLDYEPMSSNSIAIKSLNKAGDASMLGMIANDSPFYRFKPGLLVKQVDGIFCVDGMMQYDKQLRRLVYVYRYRNQYLVMDSSMNLVARGNTIDTTSVAKVKIGVIESTDSRTMAAPPLQVNNKSAVYGNWLFVNSRLLARNEHPDALEKADVIDVYDLIELKYRFSFYVFPYGFKEKLKSFIVTGDRFVAEFETHVQLFDLNPEYFPRHIASRPF